jgi:hypothetical protein
LCYLSYMLVRVLARGTSAFLLAAVLLVAGVFLSVGPALAQNGFRVTYDVDRTRPDRARVTGRVVNERAEDVFEVNMTAEALDAKGKVLSKGIAYVDSKIARGDTRAFSMSVPTVAGTTDFRVVVSSFRAGMAPQGP